MQAFRLLCALLSLAFCAPLYAFLEPLLDDGEWSAETGFEYRYFDDPGEFGQEQHALSLRFQGEYVSQWNDDTDSMTFVPFVRLDEQDENRSHADIRELLWVHVGDNWELRSGVTRVFWGRTEFNNVVDVVNQTDLVDGDEEKLGQPMVNLSLVGDEWGIFDFYWLIGFRERTFPGPDGRLRLPLTVDTDNAEYSSDTGPEDLDFAFRWQTTVTDELEMALSIFSGVDREPAYTFNFDFSDPMLIPYYSHIDQLGLELEYLHEGWAFKLEGIAVQSEIEDYQSSVTGVEYTFSGLFGSDIDMTWITEYLWDSRDESAPGFMERDLGMGARFAFNDETDTTFLAGMLWDPETDEKVASFEGERRIFSDFKIKVLARVMMERGEPELDDTTLEILADLADSPLLDNGLVDRQFVIDWLIDLIQEEGIDIIFENEGFVPALQQLQRLSSADAKLSLVESDDYVQVELIYFY